MIDPLGVAVGVGVCAVVALVVGVALCWRQRQTPEQFLARYGPWAVVFGASAGVGRAVAERLAARGFDLVLVARTRARLEAVAAAITAAHGRQVVLVDGDVRDVRTVLATRELCAGIDVGLVVYNASALLAGDFDASPLESKMALLDVNVKGATAVCDVFGTLLAARRARAKGAGLLLVSSLTGITGSRGIALYAASKAFLASLAVCFWLFLLFSSLWSSSLLSSPLLFLMTITMTIAFSCANHQNQQGGLWSEWQSKGITVRTSVLGVVDTPSLRERGVRPGDVPGILSPECAAEGCLRAFARVGPRHTVGLFTTLATFVVERLLPRALGVTLVSENASLVYGKPKAQ